MSSDTGDVVSSVGVDEDWTVVNVRHSPKPPVEPLVLGSNFPESTPDWNSLAVIHRNTLPPRSSFFLYPTPEDAESRDISRSKTQLLSGRWRFNWSKSPFDEPIDFHTSDYDALRWDTIEVPCMWQLQGYGTPQYVNLTYPFPVNPPHVPLDDNECGRYVTRFYVGEDAEDHQLRLRFEGVDSSFTCWLNDKEVGYSQGSRNPSEFDVTEHIVIGGNNVLYVEVYQRCTGSYLEDQDCWRLSGIFRDVYLHKFPKCHFEDVHVQTILDDEYRDAKLHVRIQVNSQAEVTLRLVDAEGNRIAERTREGDGTIEFEVGVRNPSKWTAETPYLYDLTLSMDGCALTEKVGFRRIGHRGCLLRQRKASKVPWCQSARAPPRYRPNAEPCLD